MRNRDDSGVETPVASLIDVVFLLIIFFVVTASIETDVVDEQIRLAQAKNSPSVEVVPPNRLIINIREDGSINIQRQVISRRHLRNLLTNMRRNVGENMAILLRADGDARYEHVAAVQEIVTDSGYYKVTLVAVAGR